jgi:hypothetical protein
VTSSAEVTGVAPDSDRPAVPAGDRLIGYVYVDDSAAIESGDIYQADRIYGYGYSSVTAASLTATVGRLQLLIDDRVFRKTSTTSLTLNASVTQTIYALPGGSFEVVNSGSDPSDTRAEPLWEHVTDGSGVTSTRDLRTFVGSLRRLEFTFEGAMSTGDQRVAAMPDGGYFRLPRPIEAGAGDRGGGTGADLRFNLYYSTDGGDAGSWTTLFTAGTAEMPTIDAADADGLTIDSQPEVTVFPRDCLVKCEVDDEPSVAASDGFVALNLEVRRV